MFTDDNIYYRDGTYGDPKSSGTGWTQIPGALKNIAVGDGIVVGTNSANAIYIRNGMLPSPFLVPNWWHYSWIWLYKIVGSLYQT